MSTEEAFVATQVIHLLRGYSPSALNVWQIRSKLRDDYEITCRPSQLRKVIEKLAAHNRIERTNEIDSNYFKEYRFKT